MSEHKADPKTLFKGFSIETTHSPSKDNVPGDYSRVSIPNKCSVLCLDFVTYVKQDPFTLKDRAWKRAISFQFSGAVAQTSFPGFTVVRSN